MKGFYNFSSTFLVILYIAGVLFGGYYLTYDAAKTQRTYNTFPELIPLMVVLTFLGLLAFLFLFLRSEGNVEIFYTASDSNVQQIDITQQSTHTNANQNAEQGGIARTLFAKAKQENVPIVESVLHSICQYLEVGIGALYVRSEQALEMKAAYALYRAEGEIIAYQLGEGLVGQVAKDGRAIKLSQIPEGYMEVVSGLGSAYPHYLMLFPAKNNNQEVKAVIELATFKNIVGQDLIFLEEMALLLAREI